jgi:hypothetical protein
VPIGSLDVYLHWPLPDNFRLNVFRSLDVLIFLGDLYRMTFTQMLRNASATSRSFQPIALVALATFLLGSTAIAQTAATLTPIAQPETRITAKVDNTQRTTLKGNTPYLAQAQYDQGAVDPSTPMKRMILSLTHSDAQETALNGLMAQQQDKASPMFHQWLTPAQFGAQFGASAADIKTITDWLVSQGFTISAIGNGRSTIEFNGTAGQVTTAFQTPIHKFAVRGGMYQSNIADPTIPTALSSVVRGVISLHNFPRDMHHASAGTFQREKATGKLTRLTAPGKTIQTPAEATFAKSASPDFTIGSNTNFYAVAPYDFATIYNLLPLWNAGIDGTGQSIAVLEETDIHVDDVRAFRSIFGLPAKDPVFIVNGVDPGITSTDEEGEAVLDTEWSGAVAKGATIDFVTSASTATTAGIDLSALYAVDYNVAPITSLSYGYCEANNGATSNAFYISLWQQGAAQGISHFVSTGDSGADGCDDGAEYATSGIGVSGFASTPYNTAVGGTDFLGTLFSPSTYWATSNNPTTQASALSYIPETTWNNNCTNFVFQTGAVQQANTPGTYNTTYSRYANPEAACTGLGPDDADGTLATIGGSGGASTVSTKPSWQTGVGVPADGHRDIPDVSLLAANGSILIFDNAGAGYYYGSFYLVCQEDTNTNGGSCSTTNPFTGIGGVGGTSVSTPAFAGILAMVNQKTNSRQGVANYVLYDLYNQQTAAGTACTSAYATTGTGPYTVGAPIMPASSCIFNDITQGSNSAGCLKNGTDCDTTTTYGILGTSKTGPEAYLNTVGYDLSVGLGSVNATNLVNGWTNVTFTPSTTTLGLSSTTFAHGTSINATITVAPASGGTGTPTGLVQLDTSTTPAALGPATLTGGTVTAAYTNLPGGTYTVDAYYTGDGTFASSTSAPVQVTVTPETSTLTGKVQLENESTGALTTVTACTYGAQCFLEFTPAGASGKGTPTGNVTVTTGGSTFVVAPITNGVVQIDTTGQIEGTGAGAFAPGTYSFSATYAGDSSFNTSSTTAPVALTIAKSGTTTTLADSAATINAGASETLTATIVTSTSLANGDDFGAFPSGTVTFYSGGTTGTNLGTVLATSTSYNANSDAPQSIFTLTTTGLPYSTTSTTALSDSITAVYSGDANYTTSTSAAKTIKVNEGTKTVTTSTLVATNTPLTYGTSTTLTDTLSFTSSNTPTGSINFYVDGILYGAAITLTSNAASVTIPALAGGSHSITAVYIGDTNFLGSTGLLSPTVSPTTDTLTLTPSATTANQGTQLTFFAAVGYTAPATPTGNITFSVDGVATASIASLPIYTGGAGATFSTSALAPGMHTISAAYAGDKNYSSSSATNVSVAISTAPLLTLSTNQHSIILLGAPVTINATLQTISGGPIPTGTISYSVDGGTVTSGVALTNGYASFVLSGLSIIRHVVTVTYSGDSTYTSTAQTLVLNGGIAQTILFPALPNTTVAVAPTLSLAARTTSGLPVTYTVTGPASLSGSILTITGTGSISVTASQAGNNSFYAATPVTHTFLAQ